MNFRDVLKKFGRNIGLKLTAVRAHAKQLFIALKHLRNCGVLHCDIKPDNMLVSEAKNVLKLCDFGNAMFAGATNNDMLRLQMELKGPFPEKMLRKEFSHMINEASVYLFFRGAFSDRLFDQDMNFHSIDEDPVTKKGVLGIKVKKMLAWDPKGRLGPTTPLSDLVIIHPPKEEDEYAKLVLLPLRSPEIDVAAI